MDINPIVQYPDRTNTSCNQSRGLILYDHKPNFGANPGELECFLDRSSLVCIILILKLLPTSDSQMQQMDYLKVESSNPLINSAVSKVFPSIVRLTCSSGDLPTGGTNGTIFSCIPGFACYILTSANLFSVLYIPEEEYDEDDEEEGISRVTKIDVRLATDKLYEGEVIACDMKYKIAVIKIKSDESLPTAMLTPFTDWISVNPFGLSGCHSPYPTKLYPGDEVTVVCSAFNNSSDALVYSGIYSADRINFHLDIKSFLRINCQEIIEGAPVINSEGDVIGVAINVVFRGDCGAFLPVNLFFKWWKQVLTYGEIRTPWMGISMANLYILDTSILEGIVHDCGVYDGFFVDQVVYWSPAASADMCPKDVVSQCDGRPVRSSLEFAELLFDKSGEVIELKGVRDGCHFVWKVQIEVIKTEILPKSLARILPKSSVEKVTMRKKSTKTGKNKSKDKNKAKKDKEVTSLNDNTRKMEGQSSDDASSDSGADRKRGRWDT